MKASVQSVRIAPKKANLIARMVRGLSVPEAVEQLRRTNKKAARIVEVVLRAAIANASHNEKQDAQTMVIKTIIVNQGTAYQRGMPMARGRQRPFRKFLSHIDIVLGYPEDEDDEKGQRGQKGQTGVKSEKKASQKGKTAVKTSGSAKKKQPVSKKTADSQEPSAS